MNIIKKGLMALAGGLLAVTMTPAISHADSTQQIRQTDLVTVKGITANGANGAAGYEFRTDGLNIHVDDSSGSYVVLRWRVGVPLASISKVDFSWNGTAGRPGIKYDVDGDGDGTVDCVLQGEQNENFVRVNNYSDQLTDSDQHGNPSYCETGVNLGGYDDSGTFADFAAKFGPKATVVNGGFSASDLVQNGVLNSVTFGNLTDTFTNQPVDFGPNATPVNTTAKRKTNVAKHAISFSFQANPLAPGTTNAKSYEITVAVNGKTRHHVSIDPGQKDYYRFVNRTKHDKIVKLYINGKSVGRYLIHKR